MTIEGATEGGSGVPSLPSTTGSMRASSSGESGWQGHLQVDCERYIVS